MLFCWLHLPFTLKIKLSSSNAAYSIRPACGDPYTCLLSVRTYPKTKGFQWRRAVHRETSVIFSCTYLYCVYFPRVYVSRDCKDVTEVWDIIGIMRESIVSLNETQELFGTLWGTAKEALKSSGATTWNTSTCDAALPQPDSLEKCILPGLSPYAYSETHIPCFLQIVVRSRWCTLVSTALWQTTSKCMWVTDFA